MRIIYTKIFPAKGRSINLCGVIFIRKGEFLTYERQMSERIRTAQMKELLYIPFYILYLLEWVARLPCFGKQAYYNISFEREAHDNQSDYEYLKTRKKYSWIKYIKNKQNESKS